MNSNREAMLAQATRKAALEQQDKENLRLTVETLRAELVDMAEQRDEWRLAACKLEEDKRRGGMKTAGLTAEQARVLERANRDDAETCYMEHSDYGDNNYYLSYLLSRDYVVIVGRVYYCTDAGRAALAAYQTIYESEA